MSSTPRSPADRPADPPELRAAFQDLNDSLLYLRSVLVDFQHELIERQLKEGSLPARTAMLATQDLIARNRGHLR